MICLRHTCQSQSTADDAAPKGLSSSQETSGKISNCISSGHDAHCATGAELQSNLLFCDNLHCDLLLLLPGVPFSRDPDQAHHRHSQCLSHSLCLSTSFFLSRSRPHATCLITCTCCDDQIKGAQDKDFSDSFSDSLSRPLSGIDPLSLSVSLAASVSFSASLSQDFSCSLSILSLRSANTAP